MRLLVLLFTLVSVVHSEQGRRLLGSGGGGSSSSSNKQGDGGAINAMLHPQPSPRQDFEQFSKETRSLLDRVDC